MLNNKVIIILSSVTNDIENTQQLQFGYWFGSQETPKLQSVTPMVAFFSAAFLIGVTAYIYNRFVVRHYIPKNRVLQPFSIGLITLSLVGGIFSFFRYSRVGFLGIRFFIAIFVISVITWTSYFAYLWRKKVPSEIIKYETRIVKKRYLRKSRA
jgi:hypothetical protein